MSFQFGSIKLSTAGTETPRAEEYTKSELLGKTPVTIIVNSCFSSLYAVSFMDSTISDFRALDQLRVE